VGFTAALDTRISNFPNLEIVCRQQNAALVKLIGTGDCFVTGKCFVENGKVQGFKYNCHDNLKAGSLIFY
jgi:hypothetical protein